MSTGYRKPHPVSSQLYERPLSAFCSGGAGPLLAVYSKTTLSLGVSACMEWWSLWSGQQRTRSLHIRPIINHIPGFLSGRVSCVQGQENGLHVVLLASALVKSLTELDLRWAALGCLIAALVFFFWWMMTSDLLLHATSTDHPAANGHCDKNRNAPSRWIFDGNIEWSEWVSGTCACNCTAPTATGPGDGHYMHASSQGQGPTGSRPPPVQHLALAEPLRRSLSRWRVGSNFSRFQSPGMYLATNKW